MLFYSVPMDATGSKSPSTEPVNVRLRAILLYKDTKNLRKNGRMRAKCDKWLVHIPFLCYLTILLNLAEGAEYGGC